MKNISYTILVLTLLVCLGGCQAGPTPPVAWPSNSPTASGGGETWNRLPVVQLAEPDQGDVEAAPSYGGQSEQLITATPSSIYTVDYLDGANTTAITSLIEVKAGALKPNSEITIWAVTYDDINDPPYILAEDLDLDKQYIQGTSRFDGGASFKIRSGLSEGSFTIYVSDGTTTLAVALEIKKVS